MKARAAWAAIALGLALAPALLHARTPAAPRSLRIASFNLEWLTATARESRMAPWKNEAQLQAHRRDLARILAEDVRADIVCVLEVTSRAALDKLAAEPALRKSGYRVLHLESGDTGTGQDVAFLVRVPLDKFGGMEIRRFADTLATPPSAAKRSRKKPVRARLTKHAVVCLTSADLKVCVMGLHLLAHPDDKRRTARREIQARIAAGLIRTEIVAKGYAPIVLGDFNDFDPEVALPADSKGERKVLALVKDFDPSRKGPEMFNFAERIQPETDRYSAYWDKNKNDARDEGELASLIDHILLDKVLSGRLVKAEILHGSHDGSVSDHWPLVVDLR
jgi:endonuclease/exonuclease/phosphatase family metal-dependent hydrolase